MQTLPLKNSRNHNLRLLDDMCKVFSRTSSSPNFTDEKFVKSQLTSCLFTRNFVAKTKRYMVTILGSVQLQKKMIETPC